MKNQHCTEKRNDASKIKKANEAKKCVVKMVQSKELKLQKIKKGKLLKSVAQSVT